MSNHGPLPVHSFDAVPDCRRCDRPGRLHASFPHSWKNQKDKDVPGTRAFVLCPNCDAQDPDATELLSLLAVCGSVTPENIAAFADLADDWVEALRLRLPDLAVLVAEEDLWQRGEL
ncbi:DUF6300 family protein [Streptomyces sp. BE133]|uniref:DUF6300 family protein n=1 Tax=Streptomyces sp. BE133 TaxID=3002523 RepID=UPI002E774E6B|nr:DUF6300 family protein [Streptomyces sp. BE133]MEE1811655.1 DUF6300 family protein [Streptomyces sp. BE133]